MAVISKGIELSYKNGTGSEFKKLTNLLEIPELGGDVEAIEITTLADEAHVYTEGLKNYGDSLAFVFNFETAQFEELNQLTGVSEWQVALPEGTTCTFSGSSSVKLAGAGIATALTYTLAIKPNSEMIWG
jgi:hypothetical protein